VLLVPGLGLAAFLAARALLPADGLVDRVANLIAFAVAAAGALAAALVMERGDYLRRAWLLQAASYLSLAIPALWRGPDEPRPLLVTRLVLTLLANAFAVAGTWLFARAHAVAGIELPWSRGARRAFFALMALVAMAAAGPSLVIELRLALSGQLAAWSPFMSSVGDVIVLALIAPLFMTTLALRGGLLVWPWGLYTAATFSWLLYDAQDTVTYLVPELADQPRSIVTVPLRVLACTLTFGAAWVQRRLSAGDPDALPRGG
jgi:hypothetical protein